MKLCNKSMGSIHAYSLLDTKAFRERKNPNNSPKTQPNTAEAESLGD